MSPSTDCVTLRREIHAVIGIERIFVHLLRETEVGDFDLATIVSSTEKDVARLEIVVNLERDEDMTKVRLRAVRWFDELTTGGLISTLRYFNALTVCMMIERASFSGMVLFCLRKKSKSFPSQCSKTVQNEFVSISKTSNSLTMPKLEENFDADQEHSVILTFMFEMFMNVVFSERVFDVVDFLLIFPFFIQLMNLTGHVPLFTQIEGSMNFTEATFSDQCQQEIAFV